MKLNLGKFSNREKILAITAAAVLILALGMGQIFSPWLEKYRSMRKLAFSQHLRLIKYNDLLKEENSIRRQYANLQGLIKTSAPAEEEMSRLLKDVDELCRNLGIKIADIKPLDQTEAGSVKLIHVEIEAETSQVNFGRLLYEVKFSPLMLEIDAFKVSLGSRGDTLKCHLVFSRLIS